MSGANNAMTYSWTSQIIDDVSWFNGEINIDTTKNGIKLNDDTK